MTVVTSTRESELRRADVDRLEVGRTTLPQALALLGSPLEIHGHTDGKLLIYRHDQTNTLFIQLDASRALQFIDTTQVLGEALSNLSFAVERIHSGEDRVGLLFDHGHVLRAIGQAWVTDDLDRF